MVPLFALVPWRPKSTKRRSRYRMSFVLNLGTSVLRISSRVVYEYIDYLFSLSFVTSEQMILRFVLNLRMIDAWSLQY